MCCRYKNRNLAKRFMVDKITTYEEHVQANILIGYIMYLQFLFKYSLETFLKPRN